MSTSTPGSFFEDYPQLTAYLSTDGSHIVVEKAAEFAAQLADVLSSTDL